MRTRTQAKVAIQAVAKIISPKSKVTTTKLNSSIAVLKPKITQKVAKIKVIRKEKIAQSQTVNSLFTLDAPIALKKSASKSLKSAKILNVDKNEESKVQQLNLSEYGQSKSFTKHNTLISKMTEWVEITILELLNILKEERKHHRDIEEEEICPICRWELYDDLFKLNKSELEDIQNKQLQDPSTIEVVKFKNCTSHFYHKMWCEGMLGSKYIKWAVCTKIYGEYIGDSPPGKMSWKYFPKGKMPIDGYKNVGSWLVNYSFYDGIRNGVNYRGTRRNAYLPDTDEGREVLLLLIKSFKQKHTFTVGDSVTTGRTNVVVWNSIHHKTSTDGGILSYGYPDPTYFNRVKLELAAKGVVTDPTDNIKSILKVGSVTIN